MTDTRKALWVLFVLVTNGINAGSALALWWAAWNELPVNPPLIFTAVVLAMNIAVAAWMLSPGKEGP